MPEKATAADSLATARIVSLKPIMKRQHTHTDYTLLSLGHFPKRAKIQLTADIELASSLIKFPHDAPALLLMLLAVLVLAFLAAIPNALTSIALFEGSAFLSALRTHRGRVGPIFRFAFGFIILVFGGYAERHGTELLISRL